MYSSVSFLYHRLAPIDDDVKLSSKMEAKQVNLNIFIFSEFRFSVANAAENKHKNQPFETTDDFILPNPSR